MGSSTMKRLLIYYWYNVRWCRLLLLLAVVMVASLLFAPWLFGSQSQTHVQKSKFGVARYKVILLDVKVEHQLKTTTIFFHTLKGNVLTKMNTLLFHSLMNKYCSV